MATQIPGGWSNFEENMRRVLPELRPIPIDTTTQIFHSFFEINSLDIIPQAYDQSPPEFYAFYRSLEAYKSSFKNKSDLLVLDPSSEFFRYLKSGASGKK